MNQKFLLSIFFISLFLLPSSLLTASNVEVVSEPDYEAIYEAETYPIIFRFTDDNGNVVEKEIRVTVKFQRTNENEAYKEVIDAHDVVIGKGLIEEFSNEQLLYLVKARAWRTDTNEAVSVSVEKFTRTATDYHELIVTTENGTKTTVHIFESEFAGESTLVQYFDFYEKNNWGYSMFTFATGVLVVVPMLIFAFSFGHVQKEIEVLQKIFYKK